MNKIDYDCPLAVVKYIEHIDFCVAKGFSCKVIGITTLLVIFRIFF